MAFLAEPGGAPILRGTDFILLAVLAAAVGMDLRTGKIRNWLTLPAAVCGPLIHLLAGGKHQALDSLAGLGVTVLVGAIFAASRMMGGGDIKLLVAVGSLAGFDCVRYALLFTALAGGVLALAVLLRRLGVVLLSKRIAQAAWLKMAGLSPSGTVGGRAKLPYSVAIAAGTTAALFWRP